MKNHENRGTTEEVWSNTCRRKENEEDNLMMKIVKKEFGKMCFLLIR